MRIRNPGEATWPAQALQIDELRAAFDPEPGSPADALIESLQTARRIMLLNRDSMSWYDANRTREEYMVDRFMDEYRDARAANGSLHRVMLKSGHMHITRGLNSLNVPTLGNFVAELARVNEATSLSIWISLMNREGEGWWSLSDYPEYRPLPDVADPDRWTLIDLRPLCSWIMVSSVHPPWPPATLLRPMLRLMIHAMPGSAVPGRRAKLRRR